MIEKKLTEIAELSEEEVKGARIANLSNRPNQSSIYGQKGLTAAEMKAKYDEFPDLVRERLNELIAAIKASLDSADALHATPIIDDIYVNADSLGVVDLRTFVEEFSKLLNDTVVDVERANTTANEAKVTADYANSVSEEASRVSQEASNVSHGAEETSKKAHETVSFLLSKIAGIATDGGGFVYGDFENNVADGEFAEAHGKNTKAKSPFAVTYGQDTAVYAARGFAGGFGCVLEGEAENSFAWGTGLRSNTRDQILLGRYNVKDPEAVLIIGDGSDDKNRSNAVAIKKDGRIVHKVTESKLLGKKISFTGDSICAGLTDPSIGEVCNYAMLLH